MNKTSLVTARRYDIDWLRVLLIIIVFVFHSLRFFDLDDWHVKNTGNYQVIEVLIAFLSRWMMPLIFVVSGYATFYALGKRRAGAGRFIKDRFMRLAVPLIAGIFTHVPLQGYLEQVSHHRYSGSFWQWYPSMFDGLYLLGGSFNWIGNHLWYLEALLIFSLVCLPLLLWLRHGSGQRVLAWLGDHLSAPGAVYLLALPTLVLVQLLNPDSHSILTDEGFGGWALPNHLVFFLSGFVFASSIRLQDSIRKLRRVSLVAGVVTFVLALAVFITFGVPPFGTPAHRLLTLASALTCWSWLLAILGYSMERLNVHTSLLDKANETVMPFYILHQSVLLVVGYFVVSWSIPDLAKWAIIFTASLVFILAICEYVINRINVLRLLFGMKPAYSEQRLHQPAPQIS